MASGEKKRGKDKEGQRRIRRDKETPGSPLNRPGSRGLSRDLARFYEVS
jgi:hypothetical protein